MRQSLSILHDRRIILSIFNSKIVSFEADIDWEMIFHKLFSHLSICALVFSWKISTYFSRVSTPISKKNPIQSDQPIKHDRMKSISIWFSDLFRWIKYIKEKLIVLCYGENKKRNLFFATLCNFIVRCFSIMFQLCSFEQEKKEIALICSVKMLTSSWQLCKFSEFITSIYYHKSNQFCITKKNQLNKTFSYFDAILRLLGVN